MKKLAYVTFLVGCLVLHSRIPASADVATNNVVSGAYTKTTSTNAVTANAAAQSVLVASSSGCTIGNAVVWGGLFPEMDTITAIADTTHFSAIVSQNHEAGAPVSCAGPVIVSVSSGSGSLATLVPITSVTYTTGASQTTCQTAVTAGHVLQFWNKTTGAMANDVLVYLGSASCAGTADFDIILGASQYITAQTGGWAITPGTQFSWKCTTAADCLKVEFESSTL